MHTSTKARAKAAQTIAAKHYESGNQSKSLKAVWRRNVFPTTYKRGSGGTFNDVAAAGDF